MLVKIFISICILMLISCNDTDSSLLSNNITDNVVSDPNEASNRQKRDTTNTYPKTHRTILQEMVKAIAFFKSIGLKTDDNQVITNASQFSKVTEFSLLPDSLTNNFKDEDLVHIKFLPNLKEIDISHHKYMTGSFLRNIKSPNKVEELYLNNNQLIDSYMVYIANMKNIIKLDISNNRIIGSGALFIGRAVKNLKELYISNNHLEKEFFTYIRGITSLEKLHIDGNPSLTHEVDGYPMIVNEVSLLGDLENLKELKIGGVFSNNTFKLIKNMHSLKDLSLTDIPMLNADNLRYLHNKINANELKVDINGVDFRTYHIRPTPSDSTDDHPKYAPKNEYEERAILFLKKMGRSPDLTAENLDLSGKEINNGSILHLEQMPNLKSLNLSNNPSLGRLGLFWLNKTIEVLDLSNNSQIANRLNFLKKLEKLRKLYLNNMQLSNSQIVKLNDHNRNLEVYLNKILINDETVEFHGVRVIVSEKSPASGW